MASPESVAGLAAEAAVGYEAVSALGLTRAARKRKAANDNTAASNTPPKVMTWAAAAPILMWALIFDGVRALFEYIGIFAPIAAGLVTNAVASSYLPSWLPFHDTLASASAWLIGGATAIFASPELEGFGMLMALILGFAGWMLIGIMILLTNARIFKESAMTLIVMILGAALTEVPLLDGLPLITGTLWAMYSRQISTEKKQFRRWQRQQAKRQEQQKKFMRAQAVQALAQANLEQQAVEAQEESAEQEELPAQENVYRPADVQAYFDAQALDASLPKAANENRAIPAGRRQAA